MKKILLILAVSVAAQASAEAAFRFGIGKGAAERAAKVMDEAVPAYPVMILPISPLESMTTGQVIWPFGVQGGGHPNGHPGIDFQTVIGASVFAAATARLARIEDDFTDGAAQKLLMFETPGYQIVYIGSMVNITVAPGDFVNRGQKIAELSRFGAGAATYGFLHWGINPRSSDQFGTNFCPYDALSSEGQRQLEALFARSTYFLQDRFPLICNPCPSGGCR